MVTFRRWWPIIFFWLLTLVLFKDLVFRHLLPIPTDILTGAYYPWLDFKWGYPVGVPVKNPMPSDVISIIYPWRILGINYLKQGLLPLWDPTILLGTPLLANFQAGLLNPFNMLFWLFQSQIAWSIEVMLQPLLIMCSTYLYLKHLKISAWVATLGAIGFALSGFSLVWLEYNTIGFTLACIPLLFYFTDKILTRPRPWAIFWLGLTLTGQILAGYPQISLYSLGFLGLYLAYKLVFAQAKLQSVFYWLIGIISGLLFSSIQLLPSLELTNLSIRASDTTAVGGNIQFLPLGHLLTLVVPDLFGNPATGNYWSTGSYDNFSFFVSGIYLFFVISALAQKRLFKLNYLFYLLMILTSLIIATKNPLSQLLINSNLLGLRSAVAARVLVFVDFALVVVAALEMDQYRQNKKVSHFYLLAVFVAIIMGLYGSLRLVGGINPNSPFDPKLAGDLSSYIQHLQIALKNTLPPLGIAAVLTVLMLLKKPKKVMLGAVSLMLVFDLARGFYKYESFTPAKLFYPQTPALAFLQQHLGFDRFDKEKAEILPTNTWTPYGLKAASGQSTLYQKTTSQYYKILDQSGTAPGRYVDLQNTNSPLYDTLDIRYLAVLNRNEKESVPDPNGQPFKQYLTSKFKPVFRDGAVTILENQTNLGFAWFTKQVQCTKNSNQASLWLSDKNYSPSLTAVIDCDQTIINSATGSAKVVKSFANTITLTTNSPNRNFLTISQAYYPGWKLTIDGQPAPIYKSNLALIAALVPEGNHTVKLNFQPKSIYYGLLMSSGSAFVWVIFLGLYEFKKRL